MPIHSQVFDLTDLEFELLRGLIHERTGLYFDESRRGLLADKLSPLVLERGFTYLDYYYLLKYDAGSAGEWARLIDTLAVPETYFWREVDQIRALVDFIVPEYAASGNPLPLRIWSAACSTGEEPLSIALALHDAGWFGRLPIYISATDVNAAAIDRARQGLFRDRSLRNLPAALRDHYFEPDSGAWRISPQLSSRVQWGVANLMVEDEILPFASASVIFCRNVFIYFSEQAIKRVVDCFHARMAAPGYLCVGVAESLLRITARFELREVGGGFVYVRL